MSQRHQLLDIQADEAVTLTYDHPSTTSIEVAMSTSYSIRLDVLTAEYSAQNKTLRDRETEIK
ncbi:hypothetical protein QCA50_002784 [Cerrena zonata]|uniref:Uncharacterized protein n=1 Tax=Cerrena zonata TaxID=2478898 RepID=A0AAW0GIQ0_9APHY